MQTFLTIKDLCELIGCSRRTLWALRTTGEAPRETRIGGKVLFHKDDVAAWVESRRKLEA